MLGSDKGVMPKHKNTLACRFGGLMGRKASKFDNYFIPLVRVAVD